MPTLDVSEAILAPEFADVFTVLRRQQTINSFDEVVVVPSTIPNVGGVVCMAGPNDLVRLPENQRMGRVLSIVTQFRLRGPSRDGMPRDYQPDIVKWNGDSFVVRWIDPYTNFGAGFIQALAGSIDSVDQPPP